MKKIINIVGSISAVNVLMNCVVIIFALFSIGIDKIFSTHIFPYDSDFISHPAVYRYITIISPLTLFIFIIWLFKREIYKAMNDKFKLKIPRKLISKIVIAIVIIILIPVGLVFSKDFKRSQAINKLIVQNDSSSKIEVIDTIKHIKKLPDKVTNVLLDNNIRIDYVPWLVSELPDYKGNLKVDAAGIFDLTRSRIVLQYAKPEGAGILNKYYVAINTFHEIGHAFDCDYVLKQAGYAYSRTPEFKDIAKQEAASLFGGDSFKYYTKEFLNYFVNDVSEYFAECFGLYFANNETNELLKQEAPLSYNYIKRVTGSKSKIANYKNNTQIVDKALSYRISDDRTKVELSAYGIIYTCNFQEISSDEQVMPYIYARDLDIFLARLCDGTQRNGDWFSRGSGICGFSSGSSFDGRSYINYDIDIYRNDTKIGGIHLDGSQFIHTEDQGAWLPLQSLSNLGLKFQEFK